MARVTDPIRLEVIRNAVAGIADGMALTVVRTSRSSIVRLGLDFSTAILSPSAELVGQGLCQPIHLGGMMPALQACLDRYEGRVYPEDILVNNDPYEGASHLPDLFLFKPVYVGDVLLGYSTVMTHHTDMGGRVPGSNATDSTEIYQEGLRIPPLKLYERGVPNETLFRLLEKAVRVPEMVLGDLQGNIAALSYGERELLSLADRFGVEELVTYEAELLDYTERITRNAIRALPDGEWTFTDYVDDDGFGSGDIAIVLKLTKRDDELMVDFTGTSPQCKGAINIMLATTIAMVNAVVRTVLGGDLPNTSGYFRPVRVIAPSGCYVNASLPAAVAGRSLGCRRVTHALFGAFAQMLPDRIPACPGGCEYVGSIGGYHREKTPWRAWVQIDTGNEIASGAFPYRDGIDGQSSPISNNTNIPAELMEADHPIMIEEYGFITDSEGAGKHRGGMGLVRKYRYLQDETTVQVRSDRGKRAPFGLYGGQSSRPTKVILTSSGETNSLPSKSLLRVQRNDVLLVEMPGGGGWGNPWERDPQQVLQDVIAEKVSPMRARELYGVEIDMERRHVDMQTTQELRKALKGQGATSQA